MGNIGDFMELAVRGTLFGQPWANVYHYQLLRQGPGPGNLITAFNTDIIPTLLTIQINNVQYTELEAFNLNQPQTEYSYAAVTHTGQLTGDGMTAFMAYGFKLVRGTKEVRNGSKRIAGVDETFVTDGVLDPLYQSAVDAVAAKFHQTLQVGGQDTFLPVICRVQGTLTGGYVIEASAEVIGADYQRITTQNSRKN